MLIYDIKDLQQSQPDNLVMLYANLMNYIIIIIHFLKVFVSDMCKLIKNKIFLQDLRCQSRKIFLMILLLFSHSLCSQSYASASASAYVARRNGSETHYNYNKSHQGFCSGLCKYEDLYRHVLITFVLTNRQECFRGQPSAT